MDAGAVLLSLPLSEEGYIPFPNAWSYRRPSNHVPQGTCLGVARTENSRPLEAIGRMTFCSISDCSEVFGRWWNLLCDATLWLEWRAALSLADDSKAHRRYCAR